MSNSFPVVFIDDMFDWPPQGKWCHMWLSSSFDLEPLHLMAEKIGLKREWFQDRAGFPHYDLRESKRTLALESGARYFKLKDWINFHELKILKPGLKVVVHTSLSPIGEPEVENRDGVGWTFSELGKIKIYFPDGSWTDAEPIQPHLEVIGYMEMKVTTFPPE